MRDIPEPQIGRILAWWPLKWVLAATACTAMWVSFPGVVMSQESRRDQSPPFNAANGKSKEATNVLQQGTNADARRRGGRTALHRAARNGSFRFSTLALQPYQINDRTGLQWNKETAKNLVPGQVEELVIEATLPEWSRLKVAE